MPAHDIDSRAANRPSSVIALGIHRVTASSTIRRGLRAINRTGLSLGEWDEAVDHENLVTEQRRREQERAGRHSRTHWSVTPAPHRPRPVRARIPDPGTHFGEESRARRLQTAKPCPGR